MRTACVPLVLYRGDTYRVDVLLWADSEKTQPIDLTGATAAAEVRYAPGDPAILTLSCAIATPNTIHIELWPEAWADFDWFTLMDAKWDLQLTWPTGDVTTIIAGPVHIRADVTDSVPPAGALP